MNGVVSRLRSITLDDPAKMNRYTTVFTYVVLFFYCFICAEQDQSLFSKLFSAEEETDHTLICIFQIFSDGIYPTTIALATTILACDFVEAGRHETVQTGLMALTAMSTILYVIIHMPFRVIGSVLHFVLMTKTSHMKSGSKAA